MTMNKRFPTGWPTMKMLSDDFHYYSGWNGTAQIPDEDSTKLASVIARAHEEGIPVRFWNAADFSNAWLQFMKLQVDYINTDHIDSLADYLHTRHFKYIGPPK